MMTVDDFFARLCLIEELDSCLRLEHRFAVGPFKLVRGWRQQKIRVNLGSFELALDHGRAPGAGRHESPNWFLMLFLRSRGFFFSVGGFKSWDLWTA